ncbi:sodium-coupled monocarboxylate transporter 1-like [Liolophura sinensis]|uniref:sodium-coupled monocarboxylate transporter 1-like n=1 Tax=Liolophura sinensis TaxID=3198878 RepID=UPI003158C5FA
MATLATTALPNQMSGLEKLYSLSYQHYTVFGSLLTVVVALIISAISGFVPSEDVDPNLYYPVMSKLCYRKKLKDKQLIKNREVELTEIAQITPLQSSEGHENSTGLYKKTTSEFSRANNTALG